MATARLYQPEDPRNPDQAIAHLSLGVQAHIRLLNTPLYEGENLAEDDPRVVKRRTALDEQWEKLTDEERAEVDEFSVVYMKLSAEERAEIERQAAEFDPEEEMRATRAAAAARAEAADTEPPAAPDAAPELSPAGKEYLALMERDIDTLAPGSDEFFKKLDELGEQLLPGERERIGDIFAARTMEPKSPLTRYLALTRLMNLPGVKVEEESFQEILASANAAWLELSGEEQAEAERILGEEGDALSRRSEAPLDDRAVPVMDPDPAAAGVVDESDGDDRVDTKDLQIFDSEIESDPGAEKKE